MTNQELALAVAEYIHGRLSLKHATENCWHGAMSKICARLEDIATDLASEGVDVSKLPIYDE